MSALLLDRVVSSYPLSIGTALAFESIALGPGQLYDPARPIPNEIPIRHYKQMWINVSTLFRNIVGAVTHETFLKASEQEFKQVLEFEMETITTILKDLTQTAYDASTGCQPVFYYCSYEKLYAHPPHPSVTFRQPSTQKQQIYAAKFLKTMMLFFKDKSNTWIRKLDSELIPDHRTSALVLTHIPYDLISAHHFRRLDLLESNTGKLKSSALWYTKYYAVPREEMNTLPFTRKFLLIFGDSVMIHPMFLEFRKLILKISQERRWTTATKEEKILQDLKLDIKEPYLVMMYKAL